jgi:hypothetical protein
VTGQLDRGVSVPVLQVELDRLRETGQVVDAEDHVVTDLAQVREHRRVGAAQFAERADGERLVPAAYRQHGPGPVQQ